VTAASQLAYLGIGGLLALGILLKFGKELQTDGLFAAYGVYGLLLGVAQSLRTAIVARLVEHGTVFENFNRFLGGVLLIFLLSGVPLVVLGGPTSDLLTGDLAQPAHEAARSALAIFWLAAGAQLVAGLAAGTLSIFDEFALPGLAYVIGAATSIPVLLLLVPVLGINAAAVGIAVGAGLTATLMLARLGRYGYRPALSGLLPSRRAVRAMKLMFAGSVASIIPQLAYVATLGFAARIGEGSVTLYTYASFAATVVVAATSGSVSIVLAAPLAQSWDRKAASLGSPLSDTFRAGLTFVLPILAVAAIAGSEIVELVLGGSLTAHDANTLATTFVALGGVLIMMVALPVPMLAAYTSSRYFGVAVSVVVTVLVSLGLNLLAVEMGSIQVLAAASSLGGILFLILILALVYGREVGTPLRTLAGHLAAAALVTVVAFLPPAFLGAALGGGPWDIASAAAGTVLFAFVLKRGLPGHWQVAQRMLEPLARARARRAAA
jgi:peptidoglycan biosynthesis protein MviN/MurJ (putative lipid II flippase)